MDPDTGTDEVADVAIRDNQIVKIAPDLGPGRTELQAKGLVVAPGFIDILASMPANKHAHTHKITDGVTTCFGMHGGSIDVEQYRRSFENSGALVNYAAAVGDRRLREAAGATDRTRPATQERLQGCRKCPIVR